MGESEEAQELRQVRRSHAELARRVSIVSMTGLYGTGLSPQDASSTGLQQSSAELSHQSQTVGGRHRTSTVSMRKLAENLNYTVGSSEQQEVDTAQDMAVRAGRATSMY
jgi:hypothetical protein